MNKIKIDLGVMVVWPNIRKYLKRIYLINSLKEIHHKISLIDSGKNVH